MPFITINLEDERGEVIESIDDKGLLVKLLPVVTEQGYCCIKYIDEYGDTVFNRIQMDDLIHELNIIKSKSKDKKEQELIKGIIGLATKCKNTLHSYIKFVGD